MNRFCSYLWVVVLIPVGRIRKTLTVAISHANSNRNKPIKQAVCDRGYVGAKVVLGANINLPKKTLKRGNRYQRDKKRKLVMNIFIMTGYANNDVCVFG
jgi:hypothetical protein